MKRPRTYRDRKWLDGYTEVAEKIGRRPFPTIHREQARHLLWIARCTAAAKVRRNRIDVDGLTAVEAGRADALLDAFGC